LNWLAHALLSPPDPDIRLANVLADILTPDDIRRLGPAFAAGVRQHRAIDAFTDRHPVVARSRARIPQPHRRYAGVLVDIFYDHCLAIHWATHSDVPFTQFIHDFYAHAWNRLPDLPGDPTEMIRLVVRNDRFGSYATLNGIRDALERLSARILDQYGRRLDLAEATATLEAHLPDFESDFALFFPELRAHSGAQAWLRSSQDNRTDGR
jgi:acyl carrier protein phosphodiesterase